MGRVKQSIGGGRTPWQEAWIRFKRNKLAMAGLALIVFLIVVSIATIVIDLVDGGATYSKYVIKQNFRNKLAPPSLKNIFGCYEFGRSILFRMIWGTRYSLFV
ncbi:MAG TPA: ABC transporter permease, partial [Negativicutes bacterium]|nr:ABC transporter permease [Negativicutes bacterium]